MGIMFHPIAQGEIDGEKDGLKTDLSLFKFTEGFDFDKFGSDYWMGFGAGYTNGQAIRARLKEENSRMSFEDKLACCQYLFSKKIICAINAQDYLDHIQNWDNLKLISVLTGSVGIFRSIQNAKSYR